MLCWIAELSPGNADKLMLELPNLHKQCYQELLQLWQEELRDFLRSPCQGCQNPMGSTRTRHCSIVFGNIVTSPSCQEAAFYNCILHHNKMQSLFNRQGVVATLFTGAVGRSAVLPYTDAKHLLDSLVSIHLKHDLYQHLSKHSTLDIPSALVFPNWHVLNFPVRVL